MKPKKIFEKFSVTRATLHNWKTTKPNLYELLTTYDEQFDVNREFKMLLEKYSKSITGEFKLEEIEYILALRLAIETLEDIENIHTIYSIAIAKEIKQNSAFVLGIYQKLANLGLIEKYLFVKRYKDLQIKLPKTKEDKQGLIKHYFKSFLISQTTL